MFVNFLVHIIGDHADNVNSCILDRSVHTIKKNTEASVVARSGDRIPLGRDFLHTVHTGPGAHPASCTMGSGSFPVVKAAGT